MIIAVCLTKEDIGTYKIGNNYAINIKDILQINFTPEAIEELYNDYKGLSEMTETEHKSLITELEQERTK